MNFSALENSIKAQDAANTLLARYGQMSVCDYIKVNHDRMLGLDRIEEIVKSLESGKAELPMERIRELGYILQQMLGFTLNNDFVLEGLRVEYLLTRFGKIILSDN